VIELFNGLAKMQIRGGHDWYRITDASDEALVEIYDEIGYFGITAADFTRDLSAVKAKTLNLRINSPGGSVFDGLTIYNRLREHPATVHVTVDGVAASIASVIAMAGDTIEMGRGSQMMIHNPSGLVMGQAGDMREMADLLDKLARDSIADVYAAKGGKDAAHWLSLMAAETWLSAREAVEAGLADSVLGDDAVTPAATAAAKVHDLAAYTFKYPGREHAPDPVVLARKNRSDDAKARVHNALGGVKRK
jgi:ATP-dependent Clp endopeptidase proteolytic subunit ClpP